MDCYNVLGIMSGTSLDGIDIVRCNFDFDKKWNFKILKAKTYKYSSDWQKKLSDADKISAIELIKLHKKYGYFLADKVNHFIKNSKIKIDFIASHGHTIFHQPDEQINFQVGDGSCIAAKTKITTISDFRSLDIALNGQGAPLVPIGDELLFNNYDYCLNLGGFANISFNNNNTRFAFDICPVNIIINHYSRAVNHMFDKGGNIAKSGNICKKLLENLNKIKYYKLNYPKSLSREWLFLEFIPVIEKFDLKTEDKLRTIYEHIAFQITKAISITGKKTVFITGGGTYNRFLIDLLKKYNNSNVFIIPDNEIIDFKEAVIFAFLGLLRFRNEINCLSSVTGASMDNSGGIISLI